MRVLAGIAKIDPGSIHEIDIRCGYLTIYLKDGSMITYIRADQEEVA